MAKFKITCDEATTICDKSQYGKATIMEIIKLRIHFLGCKLCSIYTKQNNLLSKILNKNKGGSAICSLSEEEKEQMRILFEKEKQN
ncbi:hypothetical protein [Flavicella sp.]|uniref:hypothetical protein n=1 Tax=Flavicella sp. TaxID=2957742 RepID=UPI00260A263E|nr:hypothetical protein [Flavicella sp.]MDG1803690.1 hypothetical protein [Flavicella sp.]MDG2280825.1 hypothetical protein [Flavicella sp.]